MAPFSVLIPNVPDNNLSDLLNHLHGQGYSPEISPATGGTTMPPTGRTSWSDGTNGLPASWKFVRELPGQTYAWPKDDERYDRYRVYRVVTQEEGSVHIALGDAPREAAWGRLRKYTIAFLTSGTPQTPLVEFLEVDDFDETGDMISIIRGSDGGKKMYGPEDSLPDIYNTHFRTQVYRDRIDYPRSWNKLAVIAHEEDHVTMLNHALLRARLRKDI